MTITGNIKFGTEGWRGVIAEDFTFDNVRIVSQAIADYLNKVSGNQKDRNSSVVIGYDNRFMSGKFADVVGEVFSKNHFSVIISDKSLTTPNLCYAVRSKECAIGIMITASHNPPKFNGLKIKASYGGPIPGWVAEEIEKNIKGEKIETGGYPAETLGKENLKDAYLEYLKLSVDFNTIKKIKQKIVVDYMHGSGIGYFEELIPLENLITLKNNPDPMFDNTSPEPIEKNLGLLKRSVLKKKAIIGIALDGDGDRVGIIDDRGRYLPPHIIFPLLLYYLVKYKKLSGKVVQTISLGYLSERIAKRNALEFEETPVGFKNICEKMLKEKILIGGEESGGYAAINSELPDRDGILSALIILEMLGHTGKKISVLVDELQKEFGKSYFLREDTKISKIIFDKQDFVKKIAVPDKILSLKVREVRDYDGLKIIFSDDSWLLIRPSGTEPLVRIYSETPSKEKSQKLINYGRKLVMA